MARLKKGELSPLDLVEACAQRIAEVADLALFLDTMAGFCPRDPLTFDAPPVHFSDAVAQPAAPKRVAFTADYDGRMPVDREVREICTKAARRFEELGCIVEAASPDIGRGGRGLPYSSRTALRRHGVGRQESHRRDPTSMPAAMKSSSPQRSARCIGLTLCDTGNVLRAQCGRRRRSSQLWIEPHNGFSPARHLYW